MQQHSQTTRSPGRLHPDLVQAPALAGRVASATDKIPPASFMVVTAQRSGSSWLMDRINNAPDAQGHMELFYRHPRRSPARAGCNDYPRFVETSERIGRRPRAVFAYLDGLYSRPGAIGFKLMYSQLRRYPEILPYAAFRRLRVVHLVRSNHFDVVISEELARVTGTSHATRDDARVTPCVVDIDPGTIVERVRRLQRKQQVVRSLLRLLPVPVIEVSYESLCSDDDRTFRRLLRFIGATEPTTPAASDSKLVKRQRAPHSDVVRNYPSVAAALTCAGYERLLH